MSALPGANDHEKLAALCGLTYKDQAIHFLNAYWDQFASQEAERLWGYVAEFSRLDLQNHEQGTGVDEVNAHRFLELIGETHTVLALRDKLRSTGALSPTERPKLVPLAHYLLFRYNTNWRELVNTAGDNREAIEEAQRLLDQVIAACDESERRAEAARQAEAAARREEAPFKRAQEEVDAALAEVKAQEDARNAKIEELKRKSESSSTVQSSKAKNELAQVLAEDPLPLRKAKITLEAALKKAEKARAPFEEATKRAEQARAEADDALEVAQQKVAEAEAYLEEVKRRPGTPHGAIWWIERQLAEKKKYLPTSRGGVAK